VDASILVAFATKYGSTQEVAEAVAGALREGGSKVDAQPARQVQSLEGYRAVVLSAPLYMFHWHKDALGFLSRHREALKKRPVAIFALGPLHDEEKEEQEARTQLNTPLNGWRARRPAGMQPVLAKLWPWSLGAGLTVWLLMFPGIPMLAYFSGLTDIPELVSALALCMVGFLFSAIITGFARGIQRKAAASSAYSTTGLIASGDTRL
jgi:menaquinone-dependent protoporphyrinogen oxidase